MLRRLWHRLKFEIEGFLLRGPHTRLLLVAMLIGSISALGGFLVYYCSDQFTDGGGAVWWAFLRLTDPGYLGDDQGTFVRVVSTILTVLGYVIFLGALVAIMTQWLDQTLERLKSGLTPIAETNHIVILGWSSRVMTLVHELLLSEDRIQRFLRARKEGGFRIAILADEVTLEMAQAFRDRLGDLYDPRQIILRSGSPLRIEHLRRVDYTHAAAIIYPRLDLRSGASDPDDQMLKVLLSMSASVEAGEPLPLLVAELGDARKLELARQAYRGPIEIIGADRMFARLVVQTLRSPGMSQVFDDLLTNRSGTEIYVRQIPELAGRTWAEARSRYAGAVPFAIVRSDGPIRAVVLPEDATVIEPSDRIAAIAEHWNDAGPSRSVSRPERIEIIGQLPRIRDPRSILILGWNEKVAAILTELTTLDTAEPIRVDIVSRRPAAQRTAWLADDGVSSESVVCNQIEMSTTTTSDLARLQPDTYDHIILLASDRFDEEEESDARTIVSALVLEETLKDKGTAHIVVELLDPDNEPLLRAAHREILVSPELLGHVMTQVALRRELRAVFDELFGTGRTPLEFHPLADAGLAPGHHSQRELSLSIRRHEALLVGWRKDGVVQLNPAEDETVELGADDALLVLRRC